MKNAEMKEEEVEGSGSGSGCGIHGDLLEEVFARVPLIDLAWASRVSKSWEYSVCCSLAHLNKLKPWLMIHTQNTTHAYDPRSNIWLQIRQRHRHPMKSSGLGSGSGWNLLYEVSCQGLSFSVDPLHITWHHIPAPSVWRVDPIVALVGPHVIVAGGGSNYMDMDDPLTVEMYHYPSGSGSGSGWSTCQPMPAILKDSTASTWLSVASNQHTMYVTQKASGITYSYSPQDDVWFGPYNLRPEPTIYFSAIGFAGQDLILAGLMGHPTHVKTLKIWKLNPLTLLHFHQIGEIPPHLLDKLKAPSHFLTSIALLATEHFIYIYNTSHPQEIIFCEFLQGNYCKWGSVNNFAYDDDCKIATKNMVISCTSVGISDLQIAINSGKLSFHFL